LKNVLAAGGAHPCKHMMHGSIRVTLVCLAMGKAVGMAAAHALQHHGNDVHQIDTKSLRTRLPGEAADLPDSAIEQNQTS
jgi:hypothetical protein